MKTQSRARLFATALFALAALSLSLCSEIACQSAVRDFYDPLLLPYCESGTGGLLTSQGGSTAQTTSSGTGGSSGSGGQCVAP